MTPDEQEFKEDALRLVEILMPMVDRLRKRLRASRHEAQVMREALCGLRVRYYPGEDWLLGLDIQEHGRTITYVGGGASVLLAAQDARRQLAGYVEQFQREADEVRAQRDTARAEADAAIRARHALEAEQAGTIRVSVEAWDALRARAGRAT